MRIIKSLILIFLPIVFFSQKVKKSREEYINEYSKAAVEQMNKYKIPASITLAQGILESGNGNSYLSTKGNNHFGIKCHKSWTGKKMYLDDDKKDECFRCYKNVSESYEDHSLFLINNSRYKFLFDLKITDYKEWAKGLRKAGYATNPKYAELLIKIIEANELYKYDKKSKKVIKPQPTKNNNLVLVHENNIKYIIALNNESLLDIAKKLDMGLWQLYKYNNVPKNYEISEGQVIFLQPKRNKAKTKTHKVIKGETWWSISQLHGIKLKKLKSKNKLIINNNLTPGDTLKLR